MVNGWDDYPPLGFICSPFFKIPLFAVLGMSILNYFYSISRCSIFYHYAVRCARSDWRYRRGYHSPLVAHVRRRRWRLSSGNRRSYRRHSLSFCSISIHFNCHNSGSIDFIPIGLIAGFLLSVAFVKNFKEEAWEKWPFYVVLVLYLLLMLFAVLWNTFYSSIYPNTDWESCCHACKIVYSS